MIKAIHKETIRALIHSMNAFQIKKEDIIHIVKEGDMYVLIYEDNGRKG